MEMAAALQVSRFIERCLAFLLFTADCFKIDVARLTFRCLVRNVVNEDCICLQHDLLHNLILLLSYEGNDILGIVPFV